MMRLYPLAFARQPGAMELTVIHDGTDWTDVTLPVTAGQRDTVDVLTDEAGRLFALTINLQTPYVSVDCYGTPDQWQNNARHERKPHTIAFSPAQIADTGIDESLDNERIVNRVLGYWRNVPDCANRELGNHREDVIQPGMDDNQRKAHEHDITSDRVHILRR